MRKIKNVIFSILILLIGGVVTLFSCHCIFKEPIPTAIGHAAGTVIGIFTGVIIIEAIGWLCSKILKIYRRKKEDKDVQI